jgi:hypothetical protein
MDLVRNGSFGDPKVHSQTDVPDSTLITAPERRQIQGKLFLGSKVPRAWLYHGNLDFVHLQPRIHNFLDSCSEKFNEFIKLFPSKVHVAIELTVVSIATNSGVQARRLSGLIDRFLASGRVPPTA